MRITTVQFRTQEACAKSRYQCDKFTRQDTHHHVAKSARCKQVIMKPMSDWELQSAKSKVWCQDMEVAMARSKSRRENAKCKAKKVRSRAKLGSGITSTCINKSTMCPGPRRPTPDTYSSLQLLPSLCTGIAVMTAWTDTRSKHVTSVHATGKTMRGKGHWSPKDKVAAKHLSRDKLHRSELWVGKAKCKSNVASERSKCQNCLAQSRYSEPTVEGVGKVLQVHKHEAKWQSRSQTTMANKVAQWQVSSQKLEDANSPWEATR